MLSTRISRSTAAYALAVIAGLALLLAGCGSSTQDGTSPESSQGPEEINPPGDIPDDQVFVPFTPDSGLFTVSVPEGWARSGDGDAVTFTDNLNSVRIETAATASAPDVASATTQELPDIESATTSYTPGEVTMVTRTAGEAVLITYGAESDSDPVTGETTMDSVERYEFWQDGVEVILTLSGPVGADNVDPWKIITDSFAWTS